MFRRTSLISAHFLSTLVVCALILQATAQLGTEQKSETTRQLQRVKRQFNGDNFGNTFGGGFGGGRRRGQARRGPGSSGFQNNRGGNELIFSGSPRQGQPPNNPDVGNAVGTTMPPPVTSTQNANNNNVGNDPLSQLVFINNRPTIATMAPFTGRTTASPQFLACFNGCRTTSEYNPICGSDQELYFNEQKFNCAQRCGADIQIVRRGSCQGLFPMMRG